MIRAWAPGAPACHSSLARRNFPADSDGTRVFLAGGYAPTVGNTDQYDGGLYPGDVPNAESDSNGDTHTDSNHNAESNANSYRHANGNT